MFYLQSFSTLLYSDCRKVQVYQEGAEFQWDTSASGIRR